jgi:hypothetical protein
MEEEEDDNVDGPDEMESYTGSMLELDENQINQIGDVQKHRIKKRRSIVEQTHDLRSLLNKIFALRGGWKVRKLAEDFSDGFLFQELFNILYDERIDCCLEGVRDEPNPKIPYELKVNNWNKINAGICFNYFQQQFFFVQGTMMTLAKGKNNVLMAQAIRELLVAMQGTHHNTFEDDVDVRDIADLLRINI